MRSDRFYGIGEPLIQRENDTGVPAERYLDLAAGMGCNALRNWMHLTELLLDPDTPNEAVVARHKRLLKRAAELDIEVTGMSHEWFLPEGCRSPQAGHAITRRDLTPGSLYMQTLQMLEQSWYTVAALFPEVPMWEVGNEWNNNIFLQSDGMNQGKPPFTPDEKMDTCVDLMYFSAKGIRRETRRQRWFTSRPFSAIPIWGMICRTISRSCTASPIPWSASTAASSPARFGPPTPMTTLT